MEKLEVKRETLESLNYQLADLLVFIKGVETCVKMNPQGNKEQRQATLDLCDWVNNASLKAKQTISEIIS